MFSWICSLFRPHRVEENCVTGAALTENCWGITCRHENVREDLVTKSFPGLVDIHVTATGRVGKVMCPECFTDIPQQLVVERQHRVLHPTSLDAEMGLDAIRVYRQFMDEVRGRKHG